MKRSLLISLLTILGALLSQKSEAQNVVYSQQFVNGVTYCPGSSQYDSWRTFRQSLDTSTRKFISVTFNGSQNTTGITCNDAFATRRIAAALRSATATTVINCNGVDWEVGIGCQVNGGCVNTADGVVLSATGAGTNCACSNGGNAYIIRAAIGNLNWGGINGATCGAPTQTMTVTFFDPVPNEVLVQSITAPSSNCGSTNDSISATIESQSSVTLTNVPVTCVVSGTLAGSAFNQTYSTSIAGPLTSGQRVNVRFANINTSNGANLNITVFTAQPGDPNRANDTLRTTRNLLGIPSLPTTTAGSRCGVGSVQLSATPASNADSIYWYSAATGGTFLGQGRTFNTPFITQTTTFFASAARVYLPNTTFFNSNNAVTILNTNFGIFNGFAVDVTPNKNITINNIGIRVTSQSVAEYRVYMRTGTHNGFINNTGAWTLVATRPSLQGNGPNNANFLLLNVGGIELLANTTYGFYITSLGDIPYCRSGSFSNTNADMNITGGSYAFGLFGVNGWGTGWTMDVRFDYNGACQTTRLPAIATVNPLANGSDFLQGNPFNGTLNLGSLTNPDIVAESDRITYDITNPTGLPNNQYNSTWNFNSVTFATINGTPVPTAQYTFTPPSGNNNAKFEYTPVLAWTDSTVRARFVVRRLSNGCDTTLTRIMFVAPRPDPDFTATAGCLGERTTFSNNSQIQSGTMSFEWDFGDGNSSTLVNPVHLYAQAGTYTVKLTARSNFGYTNSISKQVSVFELPQARFTFTNACEGNPLRFNDASTLPSGTTSYVWNFGDGTGSSTAKDPSYTFSTPGVYSVSMTVTVNGCSGDFQRWVTQAPRAKVDFSSANRGQGCATDEVVFTNSTSLSSGLAGYVWNFGDGNQSSEMNPQHTYSTAGTFNVVLTATTDQGCIDTKTNQVSVKPNPLASFTAPNSCDGAAVSFANTSTAPAGHTNNYSWNFGDGNTSTSVNPNHTYGSFGVFTAKLNVVSSNGCTDMIERQVTVAITPVAGFFAETVCQGTPTIFKNTTAAVGTTAYSWDFGNGRTSTDENPVETFSNAGTFNVKLVSGLGSCRDTAQANVIVNPVPSANPSATSSLDGNGNIAFTANATGATRYQWLFGDGGSSTQANPEYRYLIPSLYYATLTVWNNEGCSFRSGDVRVFINATSVSAINGELISVYPNPSSGIVTIDAGQSGVGFWEVSVSNATGIQLMKTVADFSNGKAELNLSSFAQGIYLVKLENGNQSFIHRVTIVR